MGLIYTNRYTEVEELGGVLHPANRAIGTYNTAWTTMSNFQRLIAVLDAGTIAAAGTVDMLLQQATDATGTGAKAIAGKAITQLTQAGADSNDVCAIELRTEELDVDNQFEYVRAQLIVAGNTAYTCVHVWKHVAGYPPVSVTPLTEVVD